MKIKNIAGILAENCKELLEEEKKSKPPFRGRRHALPANQQIADLRKRYEEEEEAGKGGLNQTTSNFFEQNFEIIKIYLHNISPILLEYRTLSVLRELLSKESLLKQYKVKHLGVGGNHIVFGLGEEQVIKIYYSYAANISGEESYHRQVAEYEKEIKEMHQDPSLYQNRKKGGPGAMMIYDFKEQSPWMYIITNKIATGEKAFSDQEQVDYRRTGAFNLQYKLPKEILDILNSELNYYRDVEDARWDSLNFDTGNVRPSQDQNISEPQQIVRTELPLKDKVNKLLEWFGTQYYQFKELKDEKIVLIREILKEYVKYSSQGMTDFKISNLGVNRSGHITWFDRSPKQNFMAIPGDRVTGITKEPKRTQRAATPRLTPAEEQPRPTVERPIVQNRQQEQRTTVESPIVQNRQQEQPRPTVERPIAQSRRRERAENEIPTARPGARQSRPTRVSEVKINAKKQTLWESKWNMIKKLF